MKKINKINWLLSNHGSISISRFINLSLYEKEKDIIEKKE